MLKGLNDNVYVIYNYCWFYIMSNKNFHSTCMSCGPFVCRLRFITGVNSLQGEDAVMSINSAIMQYNVVTGACSISSIVINLLLQIS